MMNHGRAAISVLGLALLCAASVGKEQDRPAALVALESARGAMLTGQVDWSIKSFAPDGEFGTRQFFTSRFAGDEAIEEYRGDAAGITRRTEQGEVDPKWGRRRTYKLLYEGDQWEHRERARNAELSRDENYVRDVRCFGLASYLPTGLGFRKLLNKAGDWRYQERIVAGGLYEVTASRIDTGRKIQYLIDPDRGWNAVRVSIFKGGEKIKESRTELKRYGDTWFPSEIEIYDSSFKDAREPKYRVSVLKAEFNEPHHDRRFVPEDIGIEIGTNIYVIKKKGHTLEGVSGWDGGKLVPITKLIERINSGELQQGPVFLEEVERAMAEGRSLEGQLSDWERHTLHFIRTYDLNEAQRQRALTILKDCQERGSAHLRRSRAQIQAIRKQVSETMAGSSTKAERSVRLAELKDRMMRLGYPLWKIFRKELIPRLEKLPTRAQRRAADQLHAHTEDKK